MLSGRKSENFKNKIDERKKEQKNRRTEERKKERNIIYADTNG